MFAGPPLRALSKLKKQPDSICEVRVNLKMCRGRCHRYESQVRPRVSLSYKVPSLEMEFGAILGVCMLTSILYISKSDLFHLSIIKLDSNLKQGRFNYR